MLKSIASLAVLALLATSTSSVSASSKYLSEEALQSQFSNWMTQHSLEYSSADEMFYRFNVYKTNLLKVEQHNEGAAKGEHSFTLGMNKFGAMTNEEYRMNVLGVNRKKKTTNGNGASGTFEATSPAAASVDWRTKGVVSPPKDQGQCGSCWAFSAVGAMEGAHALKTGKLVTLSEQDLVDCVNHGADTCDAGGEMHDGYLEVIAAGGIESEASYPYTGTSGNRCANNKEKFVASFSSYMNVTSGVEAALAAALNTIPTVSVGIDASSFLFQLYSGGVYDNSGCVNSYDELDHGVLAVGYGTAQGFFSTKDFWLIKNSWGGSWGESGYIRMARNKNNQCGVATDATFPIAS